MNRYFHLGIERLNIGRRVSHCRVQLDFCSRFTLVFPEWRYKEEDVWKYPSAIPPTLWSIYTRCVAKITELYN